MDGDGGSLHGWTESADRVHFAPSPTRNRGSVSRTASSRGENKLITTKPAGRSGTIIGCGLALILLQGCASTLPAPEAKAFRTLATADKGAFDEVVAQEALIGLERSQRLLARGQGRIALSDCGRNAIEDCTVTYSVGGFDYALVRSAPNLRALLGSVTRYADAMAELCEAKDLETVRSSSEGAAGAVKALAAIVPGVPAITGAIIDAATYAGNARLRTKRRQALLKVALAARAPVAAASRNLDAAASELRGSILAGGSENILATQEAIIAAQGEEGRLLAGRELDNGSIRPADRTRVLALRARRADGLAVLTQQAARINLARNLGADFGKLNEAHDKLIAKLRNPEASIEDALADIDAFLTLLDAIKGNKTAEG